VNEEFTIIYEAAPEGGYAAYVAEVPGAISQGETKEEAREMVLEALHELLAYRREEALSAKASGAEVETVRLSAA
jgi:predicted RNase H-like HicB family nuclease